MATNCVLRRYPNKRELSSIELELSPTYNLRKRGKLEKKDDSSLRSRSTVVAVSRRVQSKWEVFLIYWKQNTDSTSLNSGFIISQRRGKCGGESEKTTDSLKNTPSSLKFKPRQFSQVGTPNFKIFRILALARPPKCATTDVTAFYTQFLNSFTTKSRRVFVVV